MATVSGLQRRVEKLERELADLRSRLGEDTYVLSVWERSEARKGLADTLATDKEVRAVLAKYGLSFAL